jgi:enediyne biosynthesis protein E4
MRLIYMCSLVLGVLSCQKKEKTLFSLLPAAETGIQFANRTKYSEAFNMYTFRNFYNGGGVGVGDINNDGLQDVYFCGNMTPSRLYLNKGNFKFEDITEKAGLLREEVWTTGVSFADINGDGWLDIYVCKSGNPDAKGVRNNELFINNGNLTFTEKSKEYGLDVRALSTHAAFFDYDKDGDLDCYVLANSIKSVRNYDISSGNRNIRDTASGNKFFRNDKGHFNDVSAELGIYGSAIGFGLGVTVGDYNRDGWQDMYVSNDYFERDYLYWNDKKGKFKEVATDAMAEMSMGSMGADMADINNDGFPEIFVTEMLPERDDRLKTKAQFQSWNQYRMNVSNGYHHQFSRNVLQLNNKKGGFQEIGRLSGIQATDWSWGALIFDMDNDGFQDIFVANGIGKDLLDQDYMNFNASKERVGEQIRSGRKDVITKMVDSMPSEKLSNYAFGNNHDLTFTNQAAKWGLSQPSFSNGSAYVDLDNDGDLDLLVNNQDMEPFVYRNEANLLKKENHFLTLILNANETNGLKNSNSLGAQATAYAGGQMFYREVAPMRGFESCVDSRISFGLGSITTIDSLVIRWTDHKISVLKNVPTNQILKIDEKDALPFAESIVQKANPLFQNWAEFGHNTNFLYRHKEAETADFDKNRWLFHAIGSQTPKMCKGDVNGDGLEDFFITNAKDTAPALYIQLPNGDFKQTNQAIFDADKSYETTSCLFFDADGDKDLDLLLGSGGSNSNLLNDRLYRNDGKENFVLDTAVFGNKNWATACTRAADFDGDGDLDLFIGGRYYPENYGKRVSGYLLQNDGTGHFKGVTGEIAPELKELGMITDAVWADVDNNKMLDLIVVGEWMPITIFKNEGGKFKKTVWEKDNLSSGWWNCIQSADLDGDGDTDFVIGNHGLNSRFKASLEHPITMYVNDFDQNTMTEQIISCYNGTKSYPMILRPDLVSQIPSLKKKYLFWNDYKNKTVTDIFSPAQLKTAVSLKATYLQSAILINNGDKGFELKALPTPAQYAPIYAIAIDNFDQDDKIDILLGGNLTRAKPEVGTYLASEGLLLQNMGKNEFKPTDDFAVQGEIRDFLLLKTADKRAQKVVAVGLNNQQMRLFRY